MNPNGPKEFSLLSLFPYELQDTEDGYLFTTQGGVTYKLGFRLDADYFIGHDFAKALLSFSITPIEGEVTDKDPRIEATVADTLRQVFEGDPNTIIAFTCSTEGDQERQRRILFGRWYQNNGDGFTRLTHTDKKSRLYTAAIFREDHPDRNEIEETFSAVYMEK
jgi:hypothetical protein